MGRSLRACRGELGDAYDELRVCERVGFRGGTETGDGLIGGFGIGSVCVGIGSCVRWLRGGGDLAEHWRHNRDLLLHRRRRVPSGEQAGPKHGGHHGPLTKRRDEPLHGPERVAERQGPSGGGL